jgi:hypothetical protein
MTNWDIYRSEKVDGGSHRDFPGWELAPECGVWTFRRESDGVLSHHKAAYHRVAVAMNEGRW